MTSKHLHCGEPAFDVTLPEDERAGWRVWLCSVCGHAWREPAAPVVEERFTPAEAALDALRRGDRFVARIEPPAAPAGETAAGRARRLATAERLHFVLAYLFLRLSAGVPRLSEAEWGEVAEAFAHRRGHADNGPPREPTQALPASADKVLVLTARRRAGLSLHHPQDPGAGRAEENVRRLVTAQREAKARWLAEVRRRLAERGRTC